MAITVQKWLHIFQILCCFCLQIFPRFASIATPLSSPVNSVQDEFCGWSRLNGSDFYVSVITNISSQNRPNYLFPYARYIGREGQAGMKNVPKDDHYLARGTTPGLLTPPGNVIMENVGNKTFMKNLGVDIDNVKQEDIPQLMNKLGLGTHAHKFTMPVTSTTKKVRTTPLRISLLENCDYLATKCLNAYITGKVCARTMFYKYYTFNNYCLMDYVNCMERYEIWQAVHMGECFEIQKLTDYKMYPYNDDYFLDSYYVLET